MKKIALTILTAIMLSGIGIIANCIVDVAILKANIENIEKREAGFSQTLNEVNNRVIDLHWYIIKRQNVKVPDDQAIRQRKR